MVAPTSTKYLQLRMGIESGEHQQDGVVFVDDIPVGATLHARVDRPTELATVDKTDLQGYKFELAPLPAAYTAGGVLFGREAFAGSPPYVPSAANPSSRQRVLVSSGTGPVTAEQHEPLWADFGAPVTGSLRQKGKLVHAMVMPGHPTLTPNLPAEQRNLLRWRWTGTAVVAGTPHGPDAGAPGYVFAPTTITRNDGGDWTTDLVIGDYLTIATPEDVGNGGTFGPVTNVTAGVVTIASASFTINADDSTAVFVRSTTLATAAAATAAAGAAWSSGHRNLVPGSILLTLPTSGGILRDNGKGRLVGADGDGTVDYFTGEFSLKFSAAETGDILAAYEHDCGYQPLDLVLTFDPLQAA